MVIAPTPRRLAEADGSGRACWKGGKVGSINRLKKEKKEKKQWAQDRGAKKSTRKPNFSTFGPIMYILSQNMKP